MERTNRAYLRRIRYALQWLIFAMVLYSGYRFFVFVRELEQGLIPSVSRPPSIEGFMPIGAFMALKLWITKNVFDPVHPAGLVIFIGALLLALLLKKSFCGWICPVGTLSEGVWKIGKRTLGRNFTLPVYIDYPLRSIKYLLMAFFVYVILVRMSPTAIEAFLNTPYWKVADIKLLRFFTDMSSTTMVTLIVLFVLSLLYKNFWCRYLCPYGALLGLLSYLSPFKIRRNETKCISCGACSRNCPSLLPVDKRRVIHSPECNGCLTCVSNCPAKGALDMGVTGRYRIRPEFFIVSVMVLFFSLILIARMTGNWHSGVSYDELRSLVPYIDRLSHP